MTDVLLAGRIVDLGFWRHVRPSPSGAPSRPAAADWLRQTIVARSSVIRVSRTCEVQQTSPRP
jgi:hypothetical protein